MSENNPKVQQERQDGRVIYCAYIVRDGRRIYPRRAKAFRIVVG